MLTEAPLEETLGRLISDDGAMLTGWRRKLGRLSRCKQYLITAVSVLVLINICYIFAIFSIQSWPQPRLTDDSSPDSPEKEVLEGLPVSQLSNGRLQESDPSITVPKRHRAAVPSDILSSDRNPRVCIVVTTFNVIDFVGIAVESVLSQTYKNVEIIVVDDNSSDGTVDLLLNKYATAPPGRNTTYPTLQVISLSHNTNGGAGQPSNIGIDSCSEQAEYVMFADGDDYMEVDAVESMVAQAEMINSDIVMANFDSFQKLFNGSVVTIRNYDYLHWDRLPSEVPFNVSTNPNVLRISPVPWRKMYRRELLLSNNLRFPEGDYFYEDNTFHWRTLTSAARCSKMDHVLYHRQYSRAGQTSFAFNDDRQDTDITMDWFRLYTAVAKLGGLFSHFFTIGNELFPQNSGAEPRTGEVAAMFFDWLKSTTCITRKQKTEQLKRKFSRRLVQAIRHWATRSDNVLPKEYWQSLNKSIDLSNVSMSTEIDLSIIMPIANASEFIENFMESMFAQLDQPGFVFEVFAIDYGSTDDTLEVLSHFIQDHEDNFYFLSAPLSQPVGKAMNLAIPLVEGRYVYVLDVHNGYDFGGLVEAVQYATQKDNDILVLPYSVEVPGEDKRSLRQGMNANDERLWSAVRAQSNQTHNSQKEAAFGLVNYPWKQLTLSELIFDADVFFGPTTGFHDVQFHWLSIAAAKRIHFYDKEICLQNKSISSTRGGFPDVNGRDSMNVFAALGMTQRALALNGVFDGDKGNSGVFRMWKSFSVRLLNSARRKIPGKQLSHFQEREAHFLSVLGNDTGDLRRWPYWGDRFAAVPT